MKLRNFKYTVLVITLFTLEHLNAIPATPFPVKINQPDGSELTVYLKGDEFFKYKTTLDGYLIIPDKQGFYTYAQKNSSGVYESSDVRVSNVESRTDNEKQFVKKLPKEISFTNEATQARRSKASASSSTIKRAFPLSGTPKSIVILVNFSDRNFSVSDPKTSFTNLLNKEGYSDNGGTGSARDYFRDASNGIFLPDFEVYGPYTLPQTMAYYGGNDTDGYDKNPRQMVIDACNLAMAAGVNFAEYDVDNDGYVDNVFIYYAGYNEAEGGAANTVWPHRWTLANSNTKFNGKIVYDYACTSELKGISGTNMCGIGTFCHEFGHVLGLPDYYITSGTSTHQTPSYWNIMDYGAYLNQGRTPPTYAAYDRFFLNWLTPVELKTAQNVTLEPITKSNKAYIVTQNGNHNLNGANPTPVEFFTFENRQKTGWDAYLPGHGMLVSHIYYNAYTWESNSVNNSANSMGYDIVEADGTASDNNLPGDPFPGTSNVTSYTPVLRSGTVINKPLTVITETNGVITFRFMGGGDVPQIAVTGTLATFNTVQGTPSAPQMLKISGTKLKAAIDLSFANNLHFELSKEGDTQWSKSIILTPSGSTLDTVKVYVRYNPTEPSFSSIHSDKLNLTSTDADPVQVTTVGSSTRKVYVVPPVATSATNVTSWAFVANWEKVYDASGYYFTAYGVEDGESAQTEGFKNGLTAPMDWTITATSLSTSLNYSGDTIPALIFKNTDEYVETENYVIPTSGLSFFIKSISANNGKLIVNAWNGDNWKNIDTITVSSNLNTIQKYSFSSSTGYTRFRLTYVKGNGSIAVDDVSALFDKNVTLIEKNKWVVALNDTIGGLLPAVNYFYKLRASDKTLNADKTIKYENITAYSNTMSLTTASERNKKILPATIDTKGVVTVTLPDATQTIFIYNTIGQKIREVSEKKNIVEIEGLQPNQIYILKAGNRYTKIIL